MADNLGKPIVFVKVEEDYTAEAWLALVMGKALWVQCTTVEDMDQAWPQIDRRIRLVANPEAQLPPMAPSILPKPSPKANNDEVIKSLIASVEELKKENAELKGAIARIEAKLGME